jgi:hypothetical protein
MVDEPVEVEQPWLMTLSDFSHLYSRIAGLPDSIESETVDPTAVLLTDGELSRYETNPQQCLQVGLEELLQFFLIRERIGIELPRVALVEGKYRTYGWQILSLWVSGANRP